MAPSQDRRSFLRFATMGLGAVFTAILGFPIVCYLADPRNRKGKASEFIRAEGVRLDDDKFRGENPQPVQGVIRTVRVDGWTLHPSDVIGRVWVTKDETANPNDPERRGFRVFTTICPHLGCSVNLANDHFACPCHNAEFNFNGTMIDGPQLRGMDELEWRRDPLDPQLILVHYRNFRAGVEEKEEIQ